MSEAAAIDVALNEAFDRAVRARASWAGAAKPLPPPSPALEQAAKTLAKELAKRVVESVPDRHARAQTRVELYNALLPVFLDLSDRHGRAQQRLKIALWVMAFVTLGAITAAVLF